MENANVNTQPTTNTNTPHFERDTSSPKKKKANISQSVLTAIIAALCIFVILSGVLLILLVDRQSEIENLKDSCTVVDLEEDIDSSDSPDDDSKKVDLGSISENESAGERLNYSVTVNGTTLDKWRIFYNDEETNSTYVIYDSYLPNSTKLATNAGLNQDTGVYSEYGVLSEQSATDLVNRMAGVRTDAWDSLLTGPLKSSGATALGGVDIITWVKSWNSKGYKPLSLSTVEMSDGTEGYLVNDSTMLNISSDVAGYSDTLFFPTVENSVSPSDPYYGYWIDSLSIGMGYLLIATDNGELGNNIHGFHDADGVGIRPVIKIPNSMLEKSGNVWQIKNQ